MKLTKKSHACVRLEKDGQTLVIDPGGFSEEDAAVGADAILVTHEHPDHFDEARLRAGLEANPAARDLDAAQRRRAALGRLPGPGAHRRPRRHVHRRGLRRPGARRTARRDPPGHPADHQRRLPRRRFASSTPATRSPSPTTRSTR